MNIIRGNLVGTNQRPENVLVRATELTEEQKAQARANIGAASVDDIGSGGGGGNVDLTDYVKNNDYATTSKAGVVRIASAGGLHVNSTGVLYTSSANNSAIDQKISSYLPITPKYVDYAVKTGLTTNTITLTDEEKAAAQEWLGLGSLESALDSIIAIQNNLIGGDGA